MVGIDPRSFGMVQAMDETASTSVEAKIPLVRMASTKGKMTPTVVEMKIPSVETEQTLDSSFLTLVGGDILPRKIV